MKVRAQRSDINHPEHGKQRLTGWILKILYLENYDTQRPNFLRRLFPAIFCILFIAYTMKFLIISIEPRMSKFEIHNFASIINLFRVYYSENDKYLRNTDNTVRSAIIFKDNDQKFTTIAYALKEVYLEVFYKY